MSSPVRFGIVGFGGAGRAIFLHASEMSGCCPTAIYDPEPEGRKRGADTADMVKRPPAPVSVHGDFEEFLGAGIDAVIVCSPDKTHADYVVRSLRAGKHVLCEKPLTDSLDGCRMILEEAKKHPQLALAVQHQMRFLPIHEKIRTLVQGGDLGAISYVEGYYVHNLKKRAGVNHRWRFEDNATPLVYSGCHFVDLIRWLLNDEVEYVTAMANHILFPEYPESDLSVLLMKFRSGVIGKVVTAFGAARPQDHSVRVYGSRRSIENNLLFDEDGNHQVFARPLLNRVGCDNKSIRNRFTRIAQNIRVAAFGKGFEWLMRSYRNLPEYNISNYPIRLYEHNTAVRASIQSFLEAVQTGVSLRCSAADAAKTVAVCLAGVESYRTNSVVSMDRYRIPEME